ncbi:MAG TPA: glycosyltransferase family 2 protein [Phycisphaerae bacterium]|nr:glycosyltransferase family 2 protein [Phycisphaerae bacterium]
MAENANKPFVTVVMPVLNEADFIESCLASLLEQDYPPDRFEALVVDGRSTDDTREKVAAFSARHPQVRLIDNPKRIQAAAINLGVEQAKGEVIVRLDAHATYPRDYIRRCVEVLRRTGAANVGGMWETAPGADTRMARSIAILCTQRFGIGGARFRVGGEAGPVDTVPFGAFRRDVFEKVGLLDERLARGEDNEFNARIRRHGMTVYFDPAIRSTYYARGTFGGFMKQLFGNGLYHILTLKVNPRGCSLRHFVPLVFVCALLGLGVGGCFWTPAWWFGLGILALYAVADTAASLAAAWRHGWQYTAVLPWLFFCAHVCYGFGTLVGAFRFGLRPLAEPEDQPGKERPSV